MSSQTISEKVTTRTLKAMKTEGERIACMTAYDAAFSSVLDKVGVDLILVGDSVGMVVQGHATTIPVSMEEMVYHTQLVVRGNERAMIMADMPFMSYSNGPDCLKK